MLHEVVQEIAAAGKRSSDEFQLLLVDDRPVEAAAANRLAAVREAETSSFALNWLDVDSWPEFVDRLLQTCDLPGSASAIARSALLKPSGSYAGGMNKAALIAVYLGAATLHRRDSDEFPARDEQTGVTTLEVEVATLGSALPTVSGTLAVPFLVGSSVEGQPTKDHRDLERVAEHYGWDLDAISSARREGKKMQAARIASTVEVSSLLKLELEQDVLGRTQVGVSASREVYRWIPEMPAVGILGTDHFQKGLLYQLGLPVYWHPLSAFHEYEPWRAEQRDRGRLGRYAVFELRYAVLRHYWNYANETLRTLGHTVFHDGGFHPNGYADAFAAVLDSDPVEAAAVADAFVDVYARAAAQAAGPVQERLVVRVDALRDERPNVVQYVREMIQEFIGLVRMWPRLVEGAQALKDSSG